MNPVVSIIIPSLNDLKNLKKNILSIQQQSFTKYEVLIVDGGSTDGSLAFLQKLKKPFSWETNTDQGIFDAMNKGIKKAQGNWVLFLGTDDQLYNENVLNAVFEKKYDVEIELIIGSIQYNYDTDDSFWLRRKKGIVKPSWSSRLWLQNTVHHQGLLYKKDLLKKNLFSVQYNILADYALNLSFYKKGVHTAFTNTIIASCGTKGISKRYDWDLYKEEIKLKVAESNVLAKPFFYMLAFLKYSIKKVEKLF